MSNNQKIFHLAIKAGCKTAKDLAIYMNNHSKSESVRFLTISKNRAVKRYFKQNSISD